MPVSRLAMGSTPPFIQGPIDRTNTPLNVVNALQGHVEGPARVGSTPLSAQGTHDCSRGGAIDQPDDLDALAVVLVRAHQRSRLLRLPLPLFHECRRS